MNNQESAGVKRYVAWGLVGLIILVGVSIVTSIILFVPRSASTFYPFFPFFPFHLGILGGIFLIFIILWVARWLFWPWREHDRRSYSDYHRDPYDILKERYAKGEITKEQFEQMRRDLKQND